MIFVTHASRSRSKFFAQIGDQVVVELLHKLRLSLDSRARTRITAREDRHEGLSLARQHSDPPHPLALLRPRCQRPCCRANKSCDELAPSHGGCLQLGVRSSLPQRLSRVSTRNIGSQAAADETERPSMPGNRPIMCSSSRCISPRAGVPGEELLNGPFVR